MKWLYAAGLCTFLALAACTQREPETRSGAPAPTEVPPAAPASPEAQPAPGPEAPASAATPPAPEAGAPEHAARWLFAEFDWGDSEDTVFETVQYTSGFLCYRHKAIEHCAFVKTKVDGEELLTKFRFVEKRLWRIDVLTPDLDSAKADLHLERVWRLLASYITRFQGEAPEQHAFPQRDAMAPGEEVVTHRWKLPGQEIRLVVGRAKGDPPTWFTAARIVDPKWVGHEPPIEPQRRQSKTASPTS